MLCSSTGRELCTSLTAFVASLPKMILRQKRGRYKVSIAPASLGSAPLPPAHPFKRKLKGLPDFFAALPVQSAYCTAASHNIYGVHLGAADTMPRESCHGPGCVAWRLGCTGLCLYASGLLPVTEPRLVVLRLPADACSVCAPLSLRWTVLCLCVA